MRRTLIGLWLLAVCLTTAAEAFQVKNSTIVVDDGENHQVKRAVGDLQADIFRVTSCQPAVSFGKSKTKTPQIIVGTYGKSRLIERLIKQGVINEADLKGRWESYVLTVTRERQPRLVIAGSDNRGTIYGIYDVAERIGVSPWYWWADVPVRKNGWEMALFYLENGHAEIRGMLDLKEEFDV